MAQTVRWLLVYDFHHETVQALIDGVKSHNDLLEHVGEPAYTSTAAIERIEKDKPDVVLLDLGLPRSEHDASSRDEGVHCAKAIHERFPDTRIAIVSNERLRPDLSEERIRVKELEKAQVYGYIYLQDTSYEVLARAIVDVASRAPAFLPSGEYDAWRTCLKLADRDHICFVEPAMKPQPHRAMVLLARGLSNEEIGAIMKVAPGTVQKYLEEAAEWADARPPRNKLLIWAQQHCPWCRPRADSEPPVDISGPTSGREAPAGRA
jgi:DNA-binding NarL/FixJ family response regulator